jgi:hypothetical protein
VIGRRRETPPPQHQPPPGNSIGAQLLVKALSEMSGAISLAILSGMVWFGITMPAKLANLEEGQQQIIRNQQTQSGQLGELQRRITAMEMWRAFLEGSKHEPR